MTTKSLSELFQLVPALEKKARATEDPLTKRRKAYLDVFDRHMSVIDSIINRTVSEDALFLGKSNKFVLRDTKGYRYVPYYGKSRLKIGPDDKDYDIHAPDLKSLKKKLDEYRALVVSGHEEIDRALLKKQAAIDEARANKDSSDKANTESKSDEVKNEVSEQGESPPVDDTSKPADPSKTRTKARH